MLRIEGRYTKTCRYCNDEFKTDWEHQVYCTNTHKTYDYRKRRLHKAAGKICPKCGKPWLEPTASETTGTKPKYCAGCQTYYAERYQTTKQD